MSFILDALKKSETDRQRQNGPALFEVKVAPPRNGLPLWAVGLGVLLAVNLVIVAWVLLRRPAQAEANAGQGTQSFQASTGGGRGGGQYAGGAGQGPSAAQGGGQNWQGAQPGQQGQNWQGGGQPPQGQNWQGGQSGQAQNWQGQPSQGQGWQGGQPGQGQNWQGQPGQAQGQGWQGGQPGQGQNWQGGQPGQGAEAWAGAGGAPQGQQGQAVPAGGTAPSASVAQAAGPTAPGGFNGAGDTGGDKLSADDYAPATDPPPAASSFGNHVTRGTSNGVPLYQEAALQPGTRLPELRLDLHVYAALPQNRFVMINMHKLREGDSLPEGVRVESITPEGAILSKDGTRFLLPRQ